MPSVKKNFAYNVVYQLLKVLTPLVTTPYLSRILGPENIGVYSYTYSITNYFVLFAVLGMSTYGVRAIATASHERESLSRVFWSAYLSQLSIALIVCVVYVAYTFTLAQGGFLLCALWSFWVASAAIDASWLLFGVEDFKAPTIRSIAVKLLELVLIFVCVKTDADLAIYIAIMSGGYLLSQLLIWPFVPRYVDWVRPTWAEVRSHYIPNLRLFVPVVAISLYTALDKIILGTLSTMAQTGFYEYSEKISKIPMALITALGTVMLPRMASTFAEGREQEALGLIETSMWFMQVAALGMMFGIVGVAPDFVPIFFGDKFLPCIELMVVLSAIIPLISGSNVIGRQYLIPRKKDNWYTASVMVGAVVNLSVILVLIPRMGAMGAAVGTVAAEVAVLGAQAFMVRCDLPLGRYALNALPFVVVGMVMALGIRAMGAGFAVLWGGPTAVGLVLEVLLGGLLYCALACAYCSVTHNVHFTRIFSKYVSQAK